MTCVIGSPRWLCADRRITSDGARSPNERKLWRNQHLIVAGAGDVSRLHRVRAIVAGGLRNPADLIETVADDTHVLCLSREGAFVEVSAGGVWAIPSRGPLALRCIGTGGDLARGYLEGRALTEAAARAAQRMVARLRVDCGGGCDFATW
jgi:hypothetical protein